MGAEVFITKGSGPNMQKAFQEATENAAYWHGHGGYTGSLAEKDSCVEIKIPKDFMPEEKDSEKRATAFAEKLIDDCDERIDDKWGPAGAIEIGPDKNKKGDKSYLFFGWASS